ncbi:MAG: LysR substrate-binding domain-containing protein [Dermatophilus congolensis]|nr:LysR substrate-binding domain-containing protein [Dermatophilus congolensis]
MEIRQLQHAAAVAEHLHFGRAADSLHLAQPALSRSIRQLERELGIEIFARTTRQVALTSAGEHFVTEARDILHRLDQAVARSRRIADGALGPLRLGITGSATYAHLPQIISAVRDELPELALEPATDLFTTMQQEALLDGRLDAGLLRLPISDRSLEYRLLAREHLMLVVPKGHRLDGDPDVTVADLRHEPFVTYGEIGSVSVSAMLRTCQKAGFTPIRAHEAGTTSTALALVAAGVGVALLPESVKAMPFDGVSYIDIPDSASVDLALAWRNDDDRPMLLRFIDALERRGVIRAHTLKEAI